jgi:hypothetical protein
MINALEEETQVVPADKLVRVYLKMRSALDEVNKKHKAESEKIEEQMRLVKSALLTYCEDNNCKTQRTSDGHLFYRTVKKRYWTNDWDAMGRFVVEHNIPDLFEKRLHQGNTQTFLEENPDLLPPGLNVESEYSITVKKE